MRRILLIQNKRIGDVVLTAPVFHALRSAYPEAIISVVMDGACRGVDAIMPGIEPLYFYKGGLNFKFWRKIFFRQWDLCLEFTGTDRAVLVALISRASLRATYARHADSFIRRWVFPQRVESNVKTLHTIEYHLDLLKAVGISTGQMQRGISVSNTALHDTKEILKSRGIGKNFAVIHPGAARSEKMWGVDNWVRIAKFLTTHIGMDVVLTGGGNFDELEQISQILSRSSARVFSLAGSTTLEILAATIAQARIYVGVDTGAAHIADALGIPCVVLFGSTNPLHWGPRSSHGRAVGASGFSSYPHNFPKSSMQAIPVHHVEEAIKSAMEETEVEPQTVIDVKR